MKEKFNLVLLIEDDYDDIYFHRLVMEEMEIAKEIKVFYYGDEALSFLKSGDDPQGRSGDKPDLIILDINVPRLNGWEFLEEFERLPHDIKNGISIVIVTTSIDPKDRLKAGNYAAVKAFYNKPLTEDILTELLNKHIRTLPLRQDT